MLLRQGKRRRKYRMGRQVSTDPLLVRYVSNLRPFINNFDRFSVPIGALGPTEYWSVYRLRLSLNCGPVANPTNLSDVTFAYMLHNGPVADPSDSFAVAPETVLDRGEIWGSSDTREPKFPDRTTPQLALFNFDDFVFDHECRFQLQPRDLVSLTFGFDASGIGQIVDGHLALELFGVDSDHPLTTWG